MRSAGLFFFLVSFFFCESAFSQPISTYDDESLREISIPDLISTLENGLNVISFSGSEPLDVKIIKSRLLENMETSRVFYSDDIIVENDLHYDDWSDPVKEDQKIKTYLDNFNLLYPKTGDPTVNFRIIQVSRLKKRDYYYYNVLYQSKFQNKDVDGNRFVTVERVAEVRLDFDTAWTAYINGIRFADISFDINDSTYAFNAFVEDFNRSTDYKLIKLAQKRQQQMELHIKLSQLVSEGDNFYLDEKYFKALDSYKKALPLEPFNEEIRLKIKKTESAIEEGKRRKKQAEEVNARKEAMKASVVKAFNEHDFKTFKFYYDSLTIYYGYENDQDLLALNQKVSTIVPFITRMTVIEAQQNFESAKDYAGKTIKTSKKTSENVDSLLLSEAYYWYAKEVRILDSTDNNQISDNCQKALVFSSNKHMPAKKLLIQTKLSSRKTQLEALEVATSMVNYDPKNPDLRALRARVYAQLRDSDNALKDYGVAIDLKSKDSSVYMEKAWMEFNTSKYLASVLTSSSGLQLFPCNHGLYYTRILAQEKLGLIGAAGKDYQKALLCGLSGNNKESIRKIGEEYFSIGLAFFDQNKVDSSNKYFTFSYELSGNLDALFYRGFARYKLEKLDEALADLNKLVQLDSSNNHAYYMRGLIKAASGNLESAVNDFHKQVSLTSNYWKAYAAAGFAELKLERFKDAASDYGLANKQRYTDTCAAQQVYCLFRAKQYSSAVLIADEYINNYSNKNPKLIKYKGLSCFYLKEYRKAEDALSEAIDLDGTDLETYAYLIRNYLSMGDPDKGAKIAEEASLKCNSCHDVLALHGICIIADQKSGTSLNGVLKLKDAVKKSKNNATAANFAWIAYGYHLMGSEKANAESNLSTALSMDEKDPVVLFVKASILASDSGQKDKAIDVLKSLCARGFQYKYLIEKDGYLRKLKSDYKFREYLMNCDPR